MEGRQGQVVKVLVRDEEKLGLYQETVGSHVRLEGERSDAM